MRKRLFCSVVIVFIFAILFGVIQKNNNYTECISIVTQQQVLANNGYPQNKSGQTYGPRCDGDIYGVPDLLLAENKDGVLGYVHIEDTYGSSEKPILMYLEDGVTSIGEFE